MKIHNEYDIKTILYLLTLQTILQEVIKSREANSALYAIPADKRDKFEYLPWTATSGKNGIYLLLLFKTLLVKQNVQLFQELEIFCFT